MNRTKKVLAVFFSAAALAAVTAAPVAQAGSFQSEHKCSPGQQGNQHPGFKPGSC